MAPAWLDTWPAGKRVVVELDHPKRAKRRHGAKCDRRTRCAPPARRWPARSWVPTRWCDRKALSVLLAARRSAVDASTVAQRQLFWLVIAAPEHLRVRLRGRELPEMVEDRRPAAGAGRVGDGVGHRRGHAANIGPPLLGPDRRGGRAGEEDPGDRARLAPGPARPVRRRTDRGRDRAVCLVPPRPGPLRGRVRDARRRCPDPCEQRRGHHQVPPQPLRRPTAEPGPARRRAVQTALPRTEQGLHQSGEPPNGKTTSEIRRCLKRSEPGCPTARAAARRPRWRSHASVCRGSVNRTTGGPPGSSHHRSIWARLAANDRACQATIESRERARAQDSVFPPHTCSRATMRCAVRRSSRVRLVRRG